MYVRVEMDGTLDASSWCGMPVPFDTIETAEIDRVIGGLGPARSSIEPLPLPPVPDREKVRAWDRDPIDTRVDLDAIALSDEDLVVLVVEGSALDFEIDVLTPDDQTTKRVRRRRSGAG
jgi:hypothetical protein